MSAPLPSNLKPQVKHQAELSATLESRADQAHLSAAAVEEEEAELAPAVENHAERKSRRCHKRQTRPSLFRELPRIEGLS